MLLVSLVLAGLLAPSAQAGRCGALACKADLSVSGHAEPQPIRVGEHSEYAFTVQNNGPDGALTVKAHINVDQGIRVDNAVVYGGQSCSVSGTFVACDVGDLTKLQQAVVRVRVTGTTTGTFAARAEVFGYDIEDPNGGNGQATATLGVQAMSAGGGSGSTPSSGSLTLKAKDPQSILKTGGVTVRAVVPRSGTLRLRGSVNTRSGKVALVGVARGVRAGETVDVFLGTTPGNLSRIRAALGGATRLSTRIFVTLGSTKAQILLHVRR
jgi:hypothetical protein